MGSMPDSKALKTWRGEYDFAIDGGVVGTIVLRTTDGPVPIASRILGGFLDVLTACLSATGTMALNSEAAADLLAATAQAGLTVGGKSIIPVFTGASSVKMTVDRNIALVIATANFTAGKFRLVFYYQ